MDNKIKIGIISLGLIGGSILKSLMKYDYEFICVTRNQKTIDELHKMNVCASNNLEDLKECDFVFVCSPMRCVLDILDKLDDLSNGDIDVGKSKSIESKIKKALKNQ